MVIFTHQRFLIPLVLFVCTKGARSHWCKVNISNKERLGTRTPSPASPVPTHAKGARPHLCGGALHLELYNIKSLSILEIFPEPWQGKFYKARLRAEYYSGFYQAVSVRIEFICGVSQQFSYLTDFS